MGLFHSPRVVTNGLVMYLDAANIKSYSGSGTTWFDVTGNGNHGTLTNTPTFSNNSIVFNGVSNFVDISNVSIGNFGTSNFTVSCWAKATSGSSGIRGVFSKYNPHSGNGTGWFIFFRDGNIWTRITQDLVAPLEASDISLNVTANQWHNIVITRNQKAFSLYSNGQLLQTNTTTNVIDCSSVSPLRIGSGYTSGYYYDGVVSNAQMYNRALSAQEISQNFNALRGRFGI